ncbi:MAG: CHAT domain-containing protein, partial [Planctomycetota bacterium]
FRANDAEGGRAAHEEVGELRNDQPLACKAAVAALATDRGLDWRLAAKAARTLGWLQLAADAEQAAAAALAREGDDDAALAAAQAWLDIETRRGTRARLPEALLAAGHFNLATKRRAEAEDCARRALHQAQRRKDATLIAKANGLLGRTLAERGAKQDARVYLERARAGLQGEALFESLALLVDLERRIDGIEPAGVRAEEWRKAAIAGKQPLWEGRAEVTLARLEDERKDWTAAARRWDAAIDAFTRAQSNADLAAASYARGALALRVGDTESAAAALVTAQKAAGRDGAKDLRARLHAALAQLALEQGEQAKAEEELTRAARLALETGDTALAARTLARRGRLALRAGSYTKAKPLLEQALENQRKIGARVDAARTQVDLVEIELALGDRKRTRQLAAEASVEVKALSLPTETARCATYDARSRLGEEEATAVIERIRAGARTSIRMLEESGSPATARFERALDALLRVGVDAAIAANDVGTLLAASEYGRSRRMLQGLGGRAGLTRALTPEKLGAEIAALRKEEARLTRLYQEHRKRMARNPMMETRRQLETKRQEIAKAEAKRTAALADAGWLLAPSVPSDDAIAGALRPDETLLYFCGGTDSMAVIVWTKAGARIRPLGDRGRLERKVAEFREQMRGPAPDAVIATLRARLIDPLGLEDGENLVVVTTHPIDHVPIALLAPKQTVRFVVSAAELVRAARDADRQGAGVLAVGDPEFGGGELRIRLVSLRNGVPVRRSETSSKLVQEIGDSVLVGANASEFEFRNRLRTRERWLVIHVDVPGLLDARAPWQSSIALAPTKENDGLLTMHDLMRLRLPANMTILAGMQPAKGTQDVDEAIQATTKALHLAGSTRVVITRWPVSDAATAGFMLEFYRGWKERKEPIPFALRRAQEYVRTLPGTAHPRNWAGWEVWGAR